MRARLACIAIPLFPLAARLRSEPELAGEGLAIFEGNAHHARVIAASRPARLAGVRPGLTLPQARARMPRLVARARDEDCEATAQETLLEIAESFSPRVENAAPGVALLDIEGLERHFHNDDPELELGNALLLALDRVDLPARVGIASNKLAARIAATRPQTPARIRPGHEAEFLARLPLSRLAPEVEIAETLSLWGIRTIGELARLPSNEVSSRLGESGRRLHVSARGFDSQPLVPREIPPTFREGMALEWPLVNLEPFLFLAGSALERLCRRMESQGLGCLELRIHLRLEPAGRHERSVTLPSPTRDTKTLLSLLRLELEAHPPGAPIIAFRLEACPDQPRSAQLSLFGARALSPERLATTLARLFAILGGNRIGSPRAVDGHRPERFAMIDFRPPPPPDVRPIPPSARGLLIVRSLKPAVRLQVETAGNEPTPRALCPHQDAPDPPSIQGQVLVASGPWEMEEGWWTPQPVQRDYWDLEMRSGELLRIYHDRTSGGWFLDGIYD